MVVVDMNFVKSDYNSVVGIMGPNVQFNGEEELV
jgi:hypothetical protein